MYIAQTNLMGSPRWAIRESYPDQKGYRFRNLLILRRQPWEYITYPGGNAFYVEEGVTDTLTGQGVDIGDEELEDIFWPFVDPVVKRAVGAFRDRSKTVGKPMDRAQKNRLQLATPLFDKRRILYLRTGRPDQRGVGRIPPILLKWLRNKSRDEIEQRFVTMEQVLKAHEIKTYVYVIFNVQSCLESEMARRAPELFDQTVLDEHFVKTLCRFNQDETFWGENTAENSELNVYLKRYVTYFFDHDFSSGGYLNEELRAFINRHRAYRPGARKSTAVAPEAMSDVFELDYKVLKAMTKRGLTTLYRRLAQQHHPDKGGDPGKFVKLTEAYQTLLNQI